MSSREQKEKAPHLIVTTELGILTFNNEEHPLNAFSPISVTDDGIVTFVSDEQCAKVFGSITVIDVGIITLSSKQH